MLRLALAYLAADLTGPDKPVALGLSQRIKDAPWLPED